ncbi:MAG: hypothetical protein QOC88_187, partial [Mycobacterium sp.]|nr:hypothetical protein [Mycobacterium sp.]
MSDIIRQDAATLAANIAAKQ